MLEHYNTHRKVKSYLDQYDSTPVSNDLHWQWDVANFTTRALPLHQGIELALKELGDPKQLTHDLSLLYEKLPPNLQRDLEAAWIDIISVFGYDTSRPHQKHFCNLHTYLGQTGREWHYNKYRFGLLDHIGPTPPEGWQKRKHPILHLNRELLRYLSDRLGGWGGKDGPFLLSGSLEFLIRMAYQKLFPFDAVDISISSPDPHCFTAHLKTVAQTDPQTAATILLNTDVPNLPDALRRCFNTWTAYSDTASYHPDVVIKELNRAPHIVRCYTPTTQDILGDIHEVGNGTFVLDAGRPYPTLYVASFQAGVSKLVEDWGKIYKISFEGRSCTGRFLVKETFDADLSELITCTSFHLSDVEGNLSLGNLPVGTRLRMFLLDLDEVKVWDGEVNQNDITSFQFKGSRAFGLWENADKDSPEHIVLRTAIARE